MAAPMGFEQYCAVPAKDSKHFNYRIYKTKEDHQIPSAFMRLMVKEGTSRQEIIEHLDRVRDWLIAGENVRDIRPDTFFMEVEPITRLDVYQRGRKMRAKHYRARFPKGERELI